MLGTRLRSWMETHIVRSRKKQNRNNKGKSKNSPTASPTTNSNEPIQKKEGCLTRDSSEFSVGPTSMTEDNKEKNKCNLTTNLSSPESAYSTGYSTDGTSPGASIPPEYYINLRTGKHYVQASTGNTGTSEAVLQGTADLTRSPFNGNANSPRQGGPLTPSSVRKRREEILKRKQKLTEVFPESSTEEDIADRHSKCNGSQKTATPKEQRKTYHIVNEHCHRRTESYDERVRYPDLETQAHSPFPSTASPRQRNRIRTNPWLSVGPNYSSPGDTSSTVGSSSTLSSSGCRDRAAASISGAPPTARVSNYVTSQIINPRKPISPVTTCSPQPNRPCRHTRPDVSSSSSSSAPSSGTDDNHLQGGESSDYSDEDLTLNEMGKYDESYVYEKETDILSDSDPTDCEDRLCLHGKFINRGHCTYGSQNNTPEACKRRIKKQRSATGEAGSAQSSRGSSVCGRRIRRGNSREAARGEHHTAVSSSEVTPKRYRKRHQRQPSKERFKTNDEPAAAISTPLVTRVEPPIRGVEGRQMNLNRVLMERLINHQRSGTRSADGTPVSLRRNGTLEYNGKYLKNPHVSKLINSNNNQMERRGNVPDGKAECKRDGAVPKKRSNSLSAYSPPVPVRTTPVQTVKPDNAGDVKYRRLIQEAEHILEDFTYKSHRHPHYASPTLSTKSAILPCTEPPILTRPFPNECDIRSQINLIEETINNNPVPKIGNDEGILKTISKTLEKIMIRNPNIKRADKAESSQKSAKVSNKEYDESAKSYMTVISPEHDYVNSLPFQTTPCTDRNDNFFRGTLTTFAPRKTRDQNIRTNNHDRDTVANVSNRSPKRSASNPRSRLTLWENDSDFAHRTPCDRIPEDKTPTPKTPLIPFKSFDLGNQVAATSKHCPQSEPVKRKVYVCSSTFGKLKKSLMRNSPEPNYDEIVNMPTEELRDENLTLKEKVAQLRRERMEVEARVRETQQQIDRLRLSESSSHC